mgnify:CR=1 FL=1
MLIKLILQISDDNYFQIKNEKNITFIDDFFSSKLWSI